MPHENETRQLMLTDHIALAPVQGLSVRGWALPTTLSREQWHECGQALARMDEAKQWWLGDWWNAGVEWGEGKQACEATGIVYQTASDAGAIASLFENTRRRVNLTFSHHKELRVIDDPTVQDRFLLWCEEPIETTGKPRPVRELREAIKEHLESLGWTDFERERRHWVEDLGLPTLANLHRDVHLLKWAKFTGCHVYIGRGSKWGNPFEVGKDGARAYVIESFDTYYLPRKASLLDELHELDGKVLECFCLPERCHGEVLLDLIPGYCPGAMLTPWQRLDIYLEEHGLRPAREAADAS